MSGETSRFQSRYQLLLGRRVVGECAEALSEGIAVASTRYCYGDDYTDQEYELALPGGPEALAFLRGVRGADGFSHTLRTRL